MKKILGSIKDWAMRNPWRILTALGMIGAIVLAFAKNDIATIGLLSFALVTLGFSGNNSRL